MVTSAVPKACGGDAHSTCEREMYLAGEAALRPNMHARSIEGVK
jgi:hypothetical protein